MILRIVLIYQFSQNPSIDLALLNFCSREKKDMTSVIINIDLAG